VTLSDKERAELASSLIDSLDPIVDSDAELAWQEEVARRLDRSKQVRSRRFPWDEVRRKGRALLDRR
jgi:putative addiction module component (TIGR02574 family)